MGNPYKFTKEYGLLRHFIPRNDKQKVFFWGNEKKRP